MHQPKHLSQHLPAKAIGTTTPSTRQDGCHFCLPTPSPVSHHPPPVSNLLAIQPLAFNTSTHTKPSRTAQRLGVPFFWYLDGGHLPHATSCQPSHGEKNQASHSGTNLFGLMAETRSPRRTQANSRTLAPAWIGDFRHPKLSIDTTTSL